MPPPESVRISTRRRWRRGSCASASRVTSMCSAAVLDPALPGRSMIASASPAAPAPWSANAARGWNPNVFFHVGAAFSLSECAITIVASMSTGISDPSAPGARSPASVQARSRAAARALRIARSARGASAASAVISRDTTGSEATGPASSGCERSTAISARQSPAERQRHHQVSNDLPRIMHRPRCPPPGQPRRQALTQAGDPGRFGQQ